MNATPACTCDPAMYMLPSGQWVGANIECPSHGANPMCQTCFGTGRCTYPSIDAQSLVVVACPDCEIVLPTVCNCTQDGLPYCGRPECDIDWCWYCGDEYTDPCPRHAEVGRP